VLNQPQVASDMDEAKFEQATMPNVAAEVSWAQGSTPHFLQVKSYFPNTTTAFIMRLKVPNRTAKS